MINNKKSFTLIELLVTIIIASLIFTITFTIISKDFNNTNNKEINKKIIIARHMPINIKKNKKIQNIHLTM